MLVCLRRTLREKLEKLSQTSNEKLVLQKKREMSSSMNNAIRMVAINSTLHLVFKLPLAISPLENTIATFYYKNQSLFKTANFGFHIYMSKLKLSGVYYLIPELSDFLLTCLISCQLFIFAEFDKKINAGLDRFLNWSWKASRSNEIRNKFKRSLGFILYDMMKMEKVFARDHEPNPHTPALSQLEITHPSEL